MSLKIVVFYGSIRSDRQGIKAARFIVKTCQQRGHDVAMIDPLEYRLPLLDKMYKEYGPDEAPGVLQRMAQLIIQPICTSLSQGNTTTPFHRA